VRGDAVFSSPDKVFAVVSALWGSWIVVARSAAQAAQREQPPNECINGVLLPLHGGMRAR
jgi:hypothetical protein